jgi:GGDEF domain-containing protein
MLYKYENLKALDNKQSIITVPISIENRVWGIINIEEMPFVKYNLYSEQLIVMISDLAAPMVGNAMRFGELTKDGEVHPVTRLQSINEMFLVLSEEFNSARSKNLPLSLVLVELRNADELLERYSETEVLSLLRDVSDLAVKVSQGHAINFQFKETFQFAMILPSMDFDGAAMFCLNLMEKSGVNPYTLKDENVVPEIVVGYSSLRENHNAPDDLIMLAENLLEMQKI